MPRRARRLYVGLALAGVALAIADTSRAAGAPAAPPHIEAAIRYEVVASADLAELRIEADFPPGLGDTFRIEPDAARFIDDVGSRSASGRSVRLSQREGAWRADDCQRAGCRIEYVFHLRQAARAIEDPDTAALRGETLVAPASTWLLRPERLPPERLPNDSLRGRLHVVVPAPFAFVTGLPRVPDAADTYDVALLPFFVSPYSAFGRFDREVLAIGGAALELAVAAPALTADRARVRAWVTAAARAVAAYYGRFPVAHALLLAVPQASGLHGQAMGGGGATVLLQMAPGVDLTDPELDWQAAHEMVHLSVPEMSRAQLWLTEGLATYVEPLARAMTGDLRAERIWRDLALGLPKGLPEPGDRGLDRTHTWGRTYWGGALFAFVADLEIRKATKGEKSLQTALRGVLRAGGDTRIFWSIERFTSVCDDAIGKPIVTDLYHRMAEHPVDVDLPALWRELGVRLSGETLTLDDRAPLAAFRRRMVGP